VGIQSFNVLTPAYYENPLAFGAHAESRVGFSDREFSQSFFAGAAMKIML